MHWRHSVSLGHESRLGLEVNYYQCYYLRYVAFVAGWSIRAWV